MIELSFTTWALTVAVCITAGLIVGYVLWGMA